MSSPLLALFIRSVREDTRLKMTHLSRACLVSVILMFMFLTDWNIPAPGLSFFSKVIYTDCIFILLAGCGWFASVITEEKEEMTLGMLRMTNLNPLSIVLGKSTSRLFGALMLLAAQLPFTMLAITLGGVSLGQIGAAYCTLGSFLVFLANLALLASVISRRSAGAAGLTMALLILFYVFVPILSFLVGLPSRLGLMVDDAAWVVAVEKLGDYVKIASPLHRLQEILETGFHDRIFGWQAASNLGLGFICFLLAWLTFDFFCEERAEGAPASAKGPRRRFALRMRPGRAWKRALAWKDFHFVTGGKLWLIGKFIVYLLPIVAVAAWIIRLDEGRQLETIGGTTLGISFLLFCIEMAFAAANIFKVERQAQTLSTLATLPMSMERIARQKLMGLLPALSPTIIYFFLGALCFVPTLTSKDLRLSAGDHVFVLVLAYLGSQAILFLMLTANLSLRVKRGALPLAMAIQFILQLLFFSLSVLRIINNEWALAPLIMLTLFGVLFLYFETFSRLERLAAEE